MRLVLNGASREDIATDRLGPHQEHFARMVTRPWLESVDRDEEGPIVGPKRGDVRGDRSRSEKGVEVRHAVIHSQVPPWERRFSRSPRTEPPWGIPFMVVGRNPRLRSGILPTMRQTSRSITPRSASRRWLALAAAATTTLAAVSSTGAALAKKDSDEWVTICHRTNSTKNPYVVITVKESAVDGINGKGEGQGDHYGQHTGPVWEPGMPNGGDWGDIIPPVAGAHGGLNWDARGQAIWAAGCHAESVTPAETTDTDGDGTPDAADPDDDGDGTPDTKDSSGDTDGDGTPDITDPDHDGDGTPDATDPDDDGDGTPDIQDPDGDTDGDGDPNATDPDEDGDGTPDINEPDRDNDGNPDSTDPDEDGDGTPDTHDPDDDGDGTPDATDPDGDADGDNAPDLTDPDDDNDGTPDATDPDDDGDGTPDVTDPDADPDGDGDPNATDPDNDGDGTTDSNEPDLDGDGDPDSSDPDDDGDGTPDSVDPDDDNDGTPEDSANPDTDGDGTPNSTDPDDDGDGTPDVKDSDSNGDGLPETEQQRVTDPTVPERVKPGKDTTFGSKDDVTDMGKTVTYRATCSELRSTRAVPRGDIDSGDSSPLCVITQKGDRVTVRVVSADPVKIRVVASSGAVATYKGYRKVYVYKT